MSKVEDLTGQKFGKLTVKERVENDKNGGARWLCECECNNKKIISAKHLKSQKIQSCGCLVKETTSNLFKKYNTYDLTGEYGIGYTFKDEPFYFDLEDYDLIKDYCWYIDDSRYLISYYYTDNKKIKIYMHRLVMNCPDDIEIDHRNRHKNDNQKDNLRFATHSQNGMNKDLQKNNTSSVKGVSWDKENEKWRVCIMLNGKNINLGRFDNLEEAKQVRLNAEPIYHKEFRALNLYNQEV